MTHTYTAIKNGYLNEQGYVKEGSTVVLREPIECSWLKPKGSPEAVVVGSELPLMPKMQQGSPFAAQGNNAPAVADQNYNDNMEAIKKAEAAQDAAQSVSNATTAAPAPEAPAPAAPVETPAATVPAQAPAPAPAPAPAAAPAVAPAPQADQTGGNAQNGTGNQNVL